MKAIVIEQATVRALYKKLLTFYPRTFREQLGESMEQTFNDLWNEHTRQSRNVSGFLLSTFFETGVGIVHEHFLLFKEINPMQKALTNFSLSAFVSILLTLPLLIMEIVNRRNYNEEFPFVLFLGLWLNLFAISLILVPILSARRTANPDRTNPVPTQRNTLLTNPRSSAILSVAMFLSPGIFPLMDYLGWLSLDRLFNGPNPEVAYLPGLVINFLLISVPIAAGLIAEVPIVRSRRVGGSLFVHPINLIIVVFILSTIVVGLATLIIGEWSYFMGAPAC